MNMLETPQPLSYYLNRPLSCRCGRTHFVPIQGVEIGPGALAKLPFYVQQRGYQHPYLLCDPITYKIAGERCQSLLSDAGIKAHVHCLSHLGFDEATLGEIVIHLPETCDLMIGVGTGSITDMTRYASFKLGLPCFTVATAAPMDGFAASIGIMNINNLKATMPAHCTQVIIGDTDLLRGAPYRMTVAGFGDLIGKLTCLNDWQLSRLINQEHYCENIVALVRDCVSRVIQEAPKLKERDPETLGAVMNGLVLSGSAISLYGNSRPASGAEHHISHFWETVLEQQGIQPAMHGEQVAVGTVLVLLLAEELLMCSPDFELARRQALAYSKDDWEAEMRSVYGAAADEIIALENRANKNGTDGRLRRIHAMEAHWEEICRLLSSLPPAHELYRLLSDVACPCCPAQIGIDEDLLRKTIRCCKETRDRYTILQMIYDLGLTDQLTDAVINRLRTISGIQE